MEKRDGFDAKKSQFSRKPKKETQKKCLFSWTKGPQQFVLRKKKITDNSRRKKDPLGLKKGKASEGSIGKVGGS